MSLTRITFALLVIASIAAAADEDPAPAKPRRPNVLLIVADDLGYADVGFHGLKEIPTPHLDRIAAGGVRFTDAYVTAPLCSPSRAGLLTGRYQQRFGHEHNPGPAGDYGLPLGEKTIADRFRKAGYATGIVGKWHLGMTDELHPLERGFTEFFGFRHGAHPYFDRGKHRNRRDPIQRGREAVIEKAYLTDAFGREGAAFVRRHAKKPWFLLLSFNAVHLPLQASPEDIGRLEKIEDPRRRTYAAMLFAMDRAVGTVLAEVGKHGLTKDTLVIFISDNGGPTRETTSSNRPLRGQKGQVFEGGIRVPFAVRWDGRLEAGRVVRHPVSTLDILPTALAAAGIDPGKKAELDGVDLLPLLSGKVDRAPHEALFFRMGPQWAIRWGDWKLLRWEGSTQLYNLAKDIGEKKNLVKIETEVVTKMRALYAAWEEGTVPAKWTRKARRRGERRKR